GGARHDVSRHAGRETGRPRVGRRELSARRDDHGRCQEPGVPNEYEDRTVDAPADAGWRAGHGSEHRCRGGVTEEETRNMFITKKTLPRRTFLRGVGATIALPFLDAMVPALRSSAHANEVTPTRFTGIFIPHGAAPGYWVPTSDGKDFEFPYIWKPLEPFRDRVVLMSGLWSQSSEPPPGVTGADHFVAAAYLCGVKPKKTTGADVECGTTIDQVIAQKIGQETLLPSLQLAVEDPGANSTNCGEGYSCVYTNTISWAAPNRPLPMEINPQVVFERMFGDGGSPEVRAARREQQRSILDSIGADLEGLKGKVGYHDRTRVEQYLEDVREIERRLEI